MSNYESIWQQVKQKLELFADSCGLSADQIKEAQYAELNNGILQIPITPPELWYCVLPDGGLGSEADRFAARRYKIMLWAFSDAHQGLKESCIQAAITLMQAEIVLIREMHCMLNETCKFDGIYNDCTALVSELVIIGN